MQNSLQIPYHFSYLASMFDFSLVAHQNQMMSNNNNDTNSSSDGNGNTSCHFTLTPSSKSMDDSASPQQNFDQATAMSLLFPQTLLAANRFCHMTPHHEDSSSLCKDNSKMLKTKGVSSSSFMIDSLLGPDINAATRAAIKNGILPSHHHSHLGGINGINLSTSISNNQWRSEQQSSNKHGENKKENRYHPYSHVNSPPGHPQTQVLSRTKNSSNSSSATDKTQDSTQGVRRAAKAKRVRTIFTPEQLERLEAEFERQQYMVGPERLYLASSLHLTEAQVKVWFQNRRIKWRKNHLEMQQQRLAALRSQQGDLIEDDGSSDFGGSSSPTPTVASSCNTIKD